VELIENIAENYDIDKEHTQAKIVTGHHKDEDTGREFNYSLEVVIAHRSDKNFQNADEIDIIGDIKSTTPSYLPAALPRQRVPPRRSAPARGHRPPWRLIQIRIFQLR
jgi:hypothetical protein